MSDHQLQHLIKMVNQISANMHGATDEQAADKVATHLQKFWARGMKAQIIVYADSDGAQLSPVSRQAIEHLKASRQPGEKTA